MMVKLIGGVWMRSLACATEGFAKGHGNATVAFSLN